MSATDEPWHAWLGDAHRMVQQWESSGDSARLLTTTDAVRLAEIIARELSSVFERGRREGSPPN